MGCGHVGKELGKQLLALNQSPLCAVRSTASMAKLLSLNLDTVQLDLDLPLTKSDDIDLTERNIYYFAPPSSNDNKDQRIDRFLQFCSENNPNRILYISTSGVYGDCNGEWVDETSPVAPSTQRAKRRAYAEQSLIRFCQKVDCAFIILRVGGIYGAERLPLRRLQDIKVVCPDEAPYSNRIHVSDLANICRIAMESDVENEIFNVSDGHPTSMTDYFYKIADLAELPRPACVPMSKAKDKLSPGMLSFVNESRRLSIGKMKRLLKIQFQFPTLALGLENCFEKLGANKL